VAAEPPDLALGVVPATVSGTAEEVGMAYVSGLAASDRSRNGRHYTPAPLAGHLWAMTKRALGQKRPQPLSGRVVDPACGAGALLLPILREHLGAVARVDAQLALAALPNQLVGVDNDPAAVWVANVVLASEMLPILARTERARRRPLPALVRQARKRLGRGVFPELFERSCSSEAAGRSLARRAGPAQFEPATLHATLESLVRVVRRAREDYGPPMTVKLVVRYTQPADPDDFDKHYLGVHGPLVDTIPGLRAALGSEQGKAAAAECGQIAPPGSRMFVAAVDWAV